MNKKHPYDAFIGLNVHKESISVAIANPGRNGEIRFWGHIANTPSTLNRVNSSFVITSLSPVLVFLDR